MFFVLQMPGALFGLNPTAEINLKDNCLSAVEMSCEGSTSFSQNFSEGAVVESDMSTSCIEANQGFELHEYWFELNLNNYLNYFLDGNGVNGGFEVYSGTCDDLQLIDCEPAQGNNTYFAFYNPEFSTYYIRVLGYDFFGGSNFNMILQCFTPVPTCNVSIESIEVAPCINENGMVDLELTGNLYNTDPLSPLSVEILTDENVYFFEGLVDDTLWSANVQVSGSSIAYVSIGSGNSENFCSDMFSGIPLPEAFCNEVSSELIGTIAWNADCADRSARLYFFAPGTNSIIETFDIVIGNNGLFEIEEPAIGLFDMVLKVDGCLPKGFTDVSVGADNLNVIDCGSLIRGEITGDNSVNVVDISVLNEFFGQILTDDDPDHIDMNCDDRINIVDVSVVSTSFGMLGDAAPLN